VRQRSFRHPRIRFAQVIRRPPDRRQTPHRCDLNPTTVRLECRGGLRGPAHSPGRINYPCLSDKAAVVDRNASAPDLSVQRLRVNILTAPFVPALWHQPGAATRSPTAEPIMMTRPPLFTHVSFSAACRRDRKPTTLKGNHAIHSFPACALARFRNGRARVVQQHIHRPTVAKGLFDGCLPASAIGGVRTNGYSPFSSVFNLLTTDAWPRRHLSCG